MNKMDAMNMEIHKNYVDKCVAEAELTKAKETFAANLLKQYKTMDAKSFNKSYVVKKKKSARWKDFVDKIKRVLGIKPQNNIEGWNSDIYME